MTKNLNLKSMRYLTDIKNILSELRKTTKRKPKIPIADKTSQKSNYDKKKDSDLLDIRVKELESENSILAKYNEKKDYFQDTGNLGKLLKSKDTKINELKKKVLELERSETEARLKNEELDKKHFETIKEMKEYSNELKKSFEDEIEKMKIEQNKKLVEILDTAANLDTVEEREEQSRKEAEKLRNEYGQLVRNAEKEFEEKISHVSQTYELKIEENVQNSERMKNKLQSKISSLEMEKESDRQRFDNEISNYKKWQDQQEIQNQKIQERLIFLESELKDKYVLEQRVKEYKEDHFQLKGKVLDLQNSIQVFVRVKPLLIPDVNNQAQKYILKGNSIVSTQQEKTTVFNFDKVYLPLTSQSEVFHDVSYLCHGFLQGYNICVFAYGQTGSGKTHTIMGNLETKGLIPRAIEYIYKYLDEMEYDSFQEQHVLATRNQDQISSQGSSTFSYKLELKILEIYNETVRDMIKNKEIKNNELENPGYEVIDRHDILRLIEKSSETRRTEATNCNKYSSRSHTVYTLKLVQQRKKPTGHHDEIISMLNFIDLAGSERVSISGVEGARLKETQNINKSLLNLRIVFHHLINKSDYIPYRDSKLTWILKSSLENKSKTVMLLNVSIEEKDCNETICSLRFGQVAGNVEVGKSVKGITKEIE